MGPPWFGKISLPGNKAPKPRLLSLSSGACVPQVPSLRAATTEACTPRTHALQQEKLSCNEKPVQRNWRGVSVYFASRESPQAATKTQCSQNEITNKQNTHYIYTTYQIMKWDDSSVIGIWEIIFLLSFLFMGKMIKLERKKINSNLTLFVNSVFIYSFYNIS